MTRPRRLLIALVAATALAAVSVTTALLYRSSREVFVLVKRQFAEQQMATSAQTARGIEESIRLLARELEALSRDAAVRRLDRGPALLAMNRSFDYVRKMSVNDVCRTDAAGIVRIPLTSPQLVGRDFSWRRYFQEARTRTAPEPVFEFLSFEGTSRGRRGILLAMPVFGDAGEFDGTVSFIIEVSDLIASFLPRAEGATAWVADDGGTLLYHPRQANGTGVAGAAPRSGEFGAFVAALARGVPTTGEYPVGEGKRAIATAHPIAIGDRRWSVVIESDEARVRSLLYLPHLQNLLGLACAVLTILSSAAVAVWMVVRWTSRLSREVEERRRAEERLRVEEENLRITLDSIGEGVIATDAAGSVTRLNPVAAAATGWAREEALGAPLSSVFPLAGANGHDLGVDPARLAMGAGEIARWTGREHFLRARDGALRRVVLSCAPIRNPQGGTVGAVLAFRDVTEQFQTEERLRHSRKMEGLGQLAGGVAHDFNNMLSGVLGFAQLIAERAADPERSRAYARRIIDTAERAAALTAKLLSFSRRGRVESVAVDLHATVEDTLALLERSIDRRITLERRLNCGRPAVTGDPAQLQSALLNLCLNARDAMPSGGVLSVETHEVHLREERCSTSSFEISPGAYVQVSVSDTGVGMAPEVLGRIFEPFFTTKGPGHGTGLGLAAVYGTVKEHRGEIAVDSRPGHGTCFRVLLPLADRPAAPPAAAPAPARGGGGCILVVEDEEVVRECVTLTLRGLGYRVRQAADGVAGLETYRRHAGEIDGVIMDLVMPRMGGRECFEALQRLDPGVRVVLTSGFTGDDTLETLAGVGLVDFLRKPVHAAELARAAALLCAGARANGAPAAAGYSGRR